jgi:protein-S-isoprenylcysteine O-methyltransferase Ste14
MHTTFIALRTAVFAAAFVWLWTWVAALLQPFDAALGGPLPPWTAQAGVVLLCAGAILAGACLVAFVVRGRGTPALFDRPAASSPLGPYRFVRNPMYVGGALLLLGLGVSWRSPSVVLLVPAWWLLFHLLVVFYEKRTLRAKFGPEYEDYCRRTPRWTPRLPHATLAAMLLSAALLDAADGKPDFTGRWTLVPARSNFGVLPGPDARIDRVEHADPLLRVSSTQTRDGKESTGAWDCRVDGSACKVEIRGAGPRLGAGADWDGSALVLGSQGEYNGGQVRIADRWTLSTDRKTLTVSRRLASEAGETHQTLVFERQ